MSNTSQTAKLVELIDLNIEKQTNEIPTERIPDFDEGVTNVLNNSNYAMAFRLPTSDCGLANAVWIDTES